VERASFAVDNSYRPWEGLMPSISVDNTAAYGIVVLVSQIVEAFVLF
jgi:hypothetical protein